MRRSPSPTHAVFRLLGTGIAGGAILACAHQGTATGGPSGAGLRPSLARTSADPTVRGARLFPARLDEDHGLGVEPGGGVRAIAGGVRVIGLPGGAMLAADERFPRAPAITSAVPPRLGGGFLFVLPGGAVGGPSSGGTIWRADRWLSEARPIASSASDVQKLVFGLDRVYLRSRTGAVTALDARTGVRQDLGTWPAAPFVGPYAAADGWRAVAVTDLRGAVATFDAGATWRSLALPIDVKDVRLVGESIVVGGLDTARENAWYEIMSDGTVGKMGSLRASTAGNAPRDERGDKSDTSPHPLGHRPILAALEDGWPDGDGTAVIARDGALFRVRLGDGALLEHVPGAFPLAPSRCHPLALGGRGAFGFACGEVRGPTVIYAYDSARGTLSQRARFERPRVVVGFANGTFAVKGACDPNAEEPGITPAIAERTSERPADAPHLYCSIGPDGIPRPHQIPRDGDRLVVLANGTTALIEPPRGGLGPQLLLERPGVGVRAVPITFRAKDADPARALDGDVDQALRMGVWMDGFEERRPGVLGGWVDAGGTLLGIEIGLDGNALHGPFIRDPGSPMVSGRYGLGWSQSGRGVETTDGGLSWSPIDVPEPLANARTIVARACGPIGCTAAGWIRVGWGSPKRGTPPVVPLPERDAPPLIAPPLQLLCEPVAPAPPPLPEPPRSNVTRPVELHGRIAPQPIWGGGVVAVLGTTTTADLPPFYVSPAPILHPDERGFTSEAIDRLEKQPRSGPLARVYAWGPKLGEWEHAARWVARWVSPYGGWNEVRSTLPAPAPQLFVDAARVSNPSAFTLYNPWTLGVADDGAHALLASSRTSGRSSELTVFDLEDGRAPVELRRVDGEPFVEIDSAVRSGGRWYLATPPVNDGVAVVWQTDGPVARELARIPRAGMDDKPRGARLARRADGRSLGFVVEGQPLADRSGAERWILPIDLETGALGEPVALGAADLSDRPGIGPCAEELATGASDAGWILDVGWNLGTRISVGQARSLPLSSVDARLRIGPSHACIEKLAGTAGSLAPEQIIPLSRVAGVAPLASATIPVVVVSATSRSSQMRYPLRCLRRP